MYLLLIKVLRWLLSKAVLYILVLCLLLAGFLFFKLPGLLIENIEKRDRELTQAIEILEGQVQVISGKAQKTRQRMERYENSAREIQQQLAAMSDWWAWVTKWGVSWDDYQAELQRKQELAAEAERRKKETMRAVFKMNEQLRDLNTEHLLKSAQAEKVRAELAKIRQTTEEIQLAVLDSLYALYKAAAWIMLALIGVPIAYKVFKYYGVAPLVTWARPVRLEPPREDEWLRPHFGESRPAISFELQPDEELFIRERYLQGNSDDVGKQTRWLFNWRYPFTSLASGLYLLVRYYQKDPERASPCRVTLSSQVDATEELAVVDLPPGARVALRPSFLAGLAFKKGGDVKLRSFWVFNRLQSWVTFRFRYIVIEGPVKLFFAGQRGIQVEEVSGDMSGFRINSNQTIAFPTALQYRSWRAETFMSYFCGRNPLFDDFFSGDGWIVNQQVFSEKHKDKAPRFWDAALNAVGKVFGL